MIYEILRVYGMIIGYPLQWRTYYEDKKRKHAFKGGKLIISNHFNLFDYVLNAFIVFPRKLNVIASEEPFKSKITRFGMRFFGAIQCNRETRNMKFMNIAASVIKQGQLVQIFPEGRNTPDGNIHEFKHSYLVIAYRAKAPIVPIVSDGNYGPFKRTNVIIGNEIDVSQFFTSDRNTPTREELKAANDYVFNTVLRLRAELEERKKSKRRK